MTDPRCSSTARGPRPYYSTSRPSRPRPCPSRWFRRSQRRELATTQFRRCVRFGWGRCGATPTAAVAPRQTASIAARLSRYLLGIYAPPRLDCSPRVWLQIQRLEPPRDTLGSEPHRTGSASVSKALTRNRLVNILVTSPGYSIGVRRLRCCYQVDNKWGTDGYHHRRVLGKLGCVVLLAGFALVGPVASANALITPAQVIAGPSASILGVGNVAIASDGTGGVVWRQLSGGVAHIFVSRYLDGTWSAPIQVDNGQPGPATFPAIAAGDGGELLVVWVQPWASESNHGGAPETHYQLYSAVISRGRTASAATQVDPKTSATAAACSRDGARTGRLRGLSSGHQPANTGFPSRREHRPRCAPATSWSTSGWRDSTACSGRRSER